MPFSGSKTVKLACSERLAQGCSFRERIAYLERFGFEGIEARVPVAEATPERLDGIAQILAGSPLEVSLLICPGEGFTIPVDTADRRALKWAHAKKALEIGARVGGVIDILPEYQAQTPLPLSERPKQLTPLERELLLGFLRDVADYAERLSVTVGLEAINRYETRYFHRLEDVLTTIDQVGSTRLKIIADFFHMQIEEKNIATAIENAAGYIAYVQLGDSNREVPGQGHTDFRAGFGALKRIGYDGYLALECRVPEDPERQFPECIHYLRQCWQSG